MNHVWYEAYVRRVWREAYVRGVCDVRVRCVE